MVAVEVAVDQHPQQNQILAIDTATPAVAYTVTNNAVLGT
jgi:hypothetical protein